MTYQYKGKVDRTLVILSDVEMGEGGRIDDFPHDSFLRDLIIAYTSPSYNEQGVSLVFNGDTFDFLKTAYQGEFPYMINETISLAKLDRIISHHQVFFDTIDLFLQASPRHEVHFVIGNHDVDLLFLGVQEKIRQVCGGHSRVHFPGFRMKIGDVHIEHGCQLDPLFTIGSDKHFFFHRGESYLGLPWATISLLEVVMPMRDHFSELDRIKPKNLVFEIIPEMKELLMSSFWTYWRKNFFQLGANPLKKVSWKMVKEVVRRSTVFSADIAINQEQLKRVMRRDKCRLAVLGHLHEPMVWGNGYRRVIQTGCFRDEFLLENGAKKMVPIPKSYLEVTIRDGRYVLANMIESECSSLSQDRFPPFPQQFLTKIKECLGSNDERLRSRLDMEQEEQRED